MPLVFRVMRKEDDDRPSIGPASLGIRPGVDIDVDDNGDVQANGKGMSVNSGWREINITRIPKRLRPLVPGAAGSNNTHCFRAGVGDFMRGAFANGLTLEPDTATHANIAPAVAILLATYVADLAATRPDWLIDEA